MDLQLSGKSALVTGSTAGIGLAIAAALAAEGATVTLNGRTESRVSAALTEIRRATPHAKLTGFAADLGTPQGVTQLLSQLPRVDVLVNNLGIYEPKPFADLTDADWQRSFDVNVMSGVRLSRAYFPAMLKANWGRIIFISSESGVQIPAEMIQYGMTKAAQVAIARGLAELTAGTNVTINSVLVGPTKSEGVAQFVSNLAASQKKDPKQVEAEFFQHARPTSLIRRFLTPEEVAATVAYLASPRAAGINGAAVRTEGGLLKSAF
jgi:NAD(P)-dependent dehydrogenase (short-subunit alcohol dehydrogenase family)